MILGLGLVVNFVDLGDIGRRYQIKVLMLWIMLYPSIILIILLYSEQNNYGSACSGQLQVLTCCWI